MKLASQRVATFLRSPGDCRIVLLYGEDVGMIHHRADALIRVIAGSLDDPFLVAELGRGELDRLPDEAASLPLTGGRRVVRVRDATDAATGPVQVVLNSRAQALVVLEAPGLASRSKLRTLLEAAPDGTAIACHPEEGRALEETIRRTLEAATVAADQDALVWLASQLGADQVSTQAELEKLALYAGPNGRVDLDMAMSLRWRHRRPVLGGCAVCRDGGGPCDRGSRPGTGCGGGCGARWCIAWRPDAFAEAVSGPAAGGNRRDRERRGQGCAPAGVFPPNWGFHQGS